MNHQGLQSFKPEGEGETGANERSSQPYKPPVHGEETTTTAFKLLLMSGSNDKVLKSFGFPTKSWYGDIRRVVTLVPTYITLYIS